MFIHFEKPLLAIKVAFLFYLTRLGRPRRAIEKLQLRVCEGAEYVQIYKKISIIK